MFGGFAKPAPQIAGGAPEKRREITKIIEKDSFEELEVRAVFFGRRKLIIRILDHLLRNVSWLGL